MTPGVGGRSHLQLEILGPFGLEHWFRIEFERHSKKDFFFIILGVREVRYSHRVGFWFLHGFVGITIQ